MTTRASASCPASAADAALHAVSARDESSSGYVGRVYAVRNGISRAALKGSNSMFHRCRQRLSESEQWGAEERQSDRKTRHRASTSIR